MSVLSDERTEMGNIILDGPNLAAINNAFLKLQVLVAASRMHSEAGERVKQELILGLSDLRHDCGIDAVLEKVHTG